MAAQSITLTASDGTQLEAELSLPDNPRAMVVAAHPHPLYGGSMYDGVPDILFGALPKLGIGVLRFNFRGVMGSGGTHDEGRAERLDVAAAIDRAAEAGPGLPLVMAGWSFGADVSLAVDHPAVSAWCPIAPPLRIVDPPSMVAASDDRPKLVLCPEHDQFNPPTKAAPTVADWPNTELRAVPGADHFLWGHGQFLVDAVAALVDQVSGPTG